MNICPQVPVAAHRDIKVNLELSGYKVIRLGDRVQLYQVTPPLHHHCTTALNYLVNYPTLALARVCQHSQLPPLLLCTRQTGNL